MTIRNISFVILVLLCGGASAGQEQFDIPPLPAATDAARSLKLWATHYYVHLAPSASTGIPFRDKAGAVISDNISPRNWCLAAIEGTVQVSLNGEPRTLNYAGIGTRPLVDCAGILKISPLKKPWINSVGRSYFTKATGTYGDGVKGYRLIPFRTVAVDNKTLPYGTVIFIPKAKGTVITLPSGTVTKHDGYFFAGDTGGAIKGRHIDVFCGTSEKNCLPEFVTSDEDAFFDAEIVTDKAIIQHLLELHKE